MNITKERLNTKQIKEACKAKWEEFDEIKDHNQIKVLDAFKKAGIQNSHYTWVTGYGYDDLGKDKLDELYANVFNTEAALVRPQLVSGTHAITSAVFGQLDSGDKLVSLGQPYDTLCTSFNKFAAKYKINYKQVSQVGEVDSDTKLVFIQRSRGYEWRDSLELSEIEDAISSIKAINPEIIVFVDNCYGEFTQKQEPTDIGADLIAGSLIKNPGAGIVAAGAYIAGKKVLIHNAAEFLTAPGIGIHGGCMFDQTRIMMQGLFMAPLIVSEALKGMTYAAKVFEEMSLETIPSYQAERNDIIQAIKFKDRDKLIEFCKIVQNHCPINSMFSPVPDAITGYDDEIIMASGSFIEGSSIELSADAPLREPYVGYFQGGLSYAHTIHVVNKIFKALN